jgi:hypothetical protein
MAGDNQVTPEGKKPKKSVEQLRAELLADKDVKEQARLMKIDLAEYVEKIIDYALHPEKPAQLTITPDHELKQRNPNIPTMAEVETHLQKIADGEIMLNRAQQRDGFNTQDSDARFKSALATDAAQTGAPEARKGLSPTTVQVDPSKKPGNKG